LSLAKRACRVKSAASFRILVTSASAPPTHPASAASPSQAAVKGCGPPALSRRSGTLHSSWSRYPRSESAALSPRIADTAS